VEALREAGFAIELHPSLGYRLVQTPDRLVADDVWSRLAVRKIVGGGEFLREILVLAETGSTNDVAARLGRDAVAGGVLVVAESQTAGRGRFGRRWVSSAGRGLWLSLLLRPELPLERWPRLTTWAAVSTAAAVDEGTGVRSAIKWPNDVQVSGRKVAGMLIELGTDDRQQPFAVVGIGINANQEPDDFPPELRGVAQSLRMASGAAIDRPALLARLLEELCVRWREVAGDFSTLVAEAERRSSLAGEWVRVQGPAGAIEGVAEGLNPDGHLLLRRADGEVVALQAGEVTLRWDGADRERLPGTRTPY
jgi:BirA family biotin operon repressor/biotin-[acetyl-CoA-carboxylase] ligase